MVDYEANARKMLQKKSDKREKRDNKWFFSLLLMILSVLFCVYECVCIPE